MLHCIALDDEPLALEIVETFCGMTDFLSLRKTFTNPDEAARYLRNFPVDLLFLDIQMPNITGIDFYKSLPNTEIMIIFTTAYSQYAVEGFNLNAIDYLLKPFSFERFKQAVQKAQDYHTHLLKKDQSAAAHLFVRAEYSLVKIALSDILCIEGFDDYVKIHLPDRKPLLTRMNLKAIAEKLPESDFVRVHRSFIVPLRKIDNIRNKIIYLADMEIPIGANYEANFYKLFDQ
jgi:DNA-binding LytR/AlgR family response regulator